jgi:hypothetical protein
MLQTKSHLAIGAEVSLFDRSAPILDARENVLPRGTLYVAHMQTLSPNERTVCSVSTLTPLHLCAGRHARPPILNGAIGQA